MERRRRISCRKNVLKDKERGENECPPPTWHWWPLLLVLKDGERISPNNRLLHSLSLLLTTGTVHILFSLSLFPNYLTKSSSSGKKEENEGERHTFLLLSLPHFSSPASPSFSIPNPGSNFPRALKATSSLSLSCVYLCPCWWYYLWISLSFHSLVSENENWKESRREGSSNRNAERFFCSPGPGR